MSDQERIGKLRDALASAVGVIQALAEIASKQGNPLTAAAALNLATGYIQTLKDTEQ